MVHLIEKKRNGQPLTADEIDFIVQNYTAGQIPDYQMSAWAMAVFFQGMTDSEVTNLTKSMLHSGDIIDLSSIQGTTVDKHSTGGVGDTTTLVLAPLVASLGVPVAKMSGRGLGHTGGTIDKLESIPGFHVELQKEQFIQLINKNKMAIMGQSKHLVPADKKLYALRDVTGTVNSIPLIASSIMSKKIAAGAGAIVLDVKTGDGSFMKTMEEARLLAKTMVNIGHAMGRRTMAVISDMSQPLGMAIGNTLEVKEAILTLQGKGPTDLVELCLALGKQMVYAGGQAIGLEDAEKRLKEVLLNGQALATFKTFVEQQGGDTSVVDYPEHLPQAKYQIEVPAKQSGFVSKMNANNLGSVAMTLGAGRASTESTIDLAVGLMLNKKIGDSVQIGESLATIHSNIADVSSVIQQVQQSICIAQTATVPVLIHDVVM